MKTFAEAFADFFFVAILSSGGSRVTAHLCLAEWWRGVEEIERATPGGTVPHE